MNFFANNQIGFSLAADGAAGDQMPGDNNAFVKSDSQLPWKIGHDKTAASENGFSLVAKLRWPHWRQC